MGVLSSVYANKCDAKLLFFLLRPYFNPIFLSQRRTPLLFQYCDAYKNSQYPLVPDSPAFPSDQCHFPAFVFVPICCLFPHAYAAYRLDKGLFLCSAFKQCMELKQILWLIIIAPRGNGNTMLITLVISFQRLNNIQRSYTTSVSCLGIFTEIKMQNVKRLCASQQISRLEKYLQAQLSGFWWIQ